MILINKNSVNTFRLTLAEKSTLINPYYLFVFTSDVTRQVKIFKTFDSSDYPYRYNEFLITDSATENLSQGVVNFSPTGFWSYKIYEMSDANNMVVTNTTSLVEEGRAVVYGTATNFNKYNNSRTYTTYGKGA